MECVWSDEDQQYTVTIENSKSKESKRVVAEVVFFGIGPFQLPYYPKDVSGLENFKGELFHSARWRHDVALKGKRVGVIGNGCSAYVVWIYLITQLMFSQEHKLSPRYPKTLPLK